MRTGFALSLLNLYRFLWATFWLIVFLFRFSPGMLVAEDAVSGLALLSCGKCRTGIFQLK